MPLGGGGQLDRLPAHFGAGRAGLPQRLGRLLAASPARRTARHLDLDLGLGRLAPDGIKELGLVGSQAAVVPRPHQQLDPSQLALLGQQGLHIRLAVQDRNQLGIRQLARDSGASPESMGTFCVPRAVVRVRPARRSSHTES